MFRGTDSREGLGAMRSSIGRVDKCDITKIETNSTAFHPLRRRCEPTKVSTPRCHPRAPTDVRVESSTGISRPALVAQSDIPPPPRSNLLHSHSSEPQMVAF